MKIRSLTLSITILAALTGCSQISESGSQVAKFGQQVGGAGLSAVGGQQLLGGQRKEDDYASATPIDRLAVPPALRMPSREAIIQQRDASIEQQRARIQQQRNMRAQQQQNTLTSAGIRPQAAPTPASTRPLNSNKNYFVVVGTYPDSEQALDTFVRLSSIGLPNATMESRKARSGKTLHMVRLGPFKRQDQIDKIKDSLQADGLTQFKVVES